MKKRENAFIPKTLLQIFIYVALTTLVMVVGIAGILYKDYEKIGLKTAYDYNIKYLRQLSYNISYMNDFIVQYCITQYSEADMQKFMHSTEETGDTFYFNYVRSIGKLQNTILISPMIHSVVVYNRYMDKVYSTSPYMGNKDEQLEIFFKNDTPVEILKPVPRIITNDIYYRDRGVLDERIKLFTYFMTENNRNSNEYGSILAVNIYTEWIFNNLKQEPDSEESKLMLIDMEGTVIADDSNTVREFEKLNDKYFQKIIESKGEDRAFAIDTESGKKVITCLTIPELKWILVNEQPYNTVIDFINQARIRTFIAVAVFVILAIIAAFIASREIYNPINRLVYQIKRSLSKSLADINDENDMDYIQKAFNISLQHIQELENYKESTRDILKEYIFRTLIADNSSHMLNLSEEDLNNMTIMSREGEKVIVLVKIDGYNQFIEKSNEERKMIRFLITNSFIEKLSGRYPVEPIPMGNGEIIFIIDIHQNPHNSVLAEIKSVIANIQAYIIKTSGISFSAFISEIAKNNRRLYSCYMDLSEIVKYRIMFSANSILDRDAVEVKMVQKDHKYPEEIDNSICASIKEGNLEKAINEFGRFMDIISMMNVNKFMMSISRLAISIDKTINLININKIGEISVNFSNFFITISKMETIDDIIMEFRGLISFIINQINEMNKDKNSRLVDMVVDYINENFNDKNLNLYDISSRYKISYGYLLALFKENKNQSLPDYLNSVRMQKAAELLATTNYSIKEIMDAVGFENESSFYRNFKRNFGTTPREFRTSKLMIKEKNV